MISRNSLLLGSGNWCEEMWIEIFDRARKKRKVVKAKVGDHEFRYAMINPKEGYGRDSISADGTLYDYSGQMVTFWIKYAENEGNVGLNEGGLAFVLERTLPQREFADYVGLHEHVEATRGKDQHGEACITELSEVLKREPGFIDAYANWLVGLTNKSKNPERGYFGRAIPDILQVIRKGNLSPTEVLREFKHQLDLRYHLK